MPKSSTTAVSPLLNQRLIAYAIGAAGAVSLVPQLEAQVIYTATDLRLNQGALNLDLNNDGQPDIQLYDLQTYGYPSIGGSLFVRSAKSAPAAAVLGLSGRHGKVAYAARPGASIGPSSPQDFIPVSAFFWMAEAIVTYYHARVAGPWANQKDKFLGIRFPINGQNHYGWVRMTVNAQLPQIPFRPTVVAKITGYAYEATADKAIIAGDRGSGSRVANAGSLGALALGAARVGARH